jgi:hypothetical protein
MEALLFGKYHIAQKTLTNDKNTSDRLSEPDLIFDTL